MRLRWCCSVAVLALVARACGKSAFGQSVLVVFDADRSEADYATFLGSLRHRGFDLTVRRTTSGASLFEYDEAAFDHLIVLAPNAKGITADLSAQNVYDFLAADGPARPHNVLIALDSSASETWRDFAREFSLEFEGRTTAMIDYFGGASEPDVLSVRSTSPPGSYASVLSAETLAGPPIAYRGIGHAVPASFPLALPLLSAPPTAFSAAKVGSDIDDEPVPYAPFSLVTGFQATNNARILWSGSVELFSDTFARPDTGNAAFVRDVTTWLLGERGVLRVENIVHTKVGETASRDQYRIKDDWTYSAEISEWRDDAWRPVDLPELQLELTMLDPHIRMPLLPSALERSAGVSTAAESTLYGATTVLPTRHGVFTARLRHLRTPALSWLDEAVRFSITPLRHDEYPRFLVGAWPYYAGVASTALAWWIFSVLWLSLDHRDPVAPASQKVE